MKILSFEEICKITFGALDIKQESDGIHFYKCTEKQNKAWTALSHDLGVRALTTTGIRFDFITDSKILKLAAVSGNKFDIWINGLLQEQILMDDLSDRISNVNLGDGEKRVMIAFPSHTTAVLSSVEIEEKSFLKPSKFDRKMLFLGDSITQGWESEYDTLSYAYRVGMNFDADFVIQGIGGAYYHKSTFDTDIKYEPDTVIVALGTNDYFSYHDVGLVIDASREYLSLVKQRYSDRRIVVITPIWRADKDEESLANKFMPIRKGIEKEALNLGLEVVDGFKMVPHIGKFFADGFLHPNDMGFGIYADNLIQYLTI